MCLHSSDYPFSVHRPNQRNLLPRMPDLPFCPSSWAATGKGESPCTESYHCANAPAAAPDMYNAEVPALLHAIRTDPSMQKDTGGRRGWREPPEASCVADDRLFVYPAGVHFDNQVRMEQP